MKKLVIGMSSLGKKIFIGSLIKGGRVWGANKTDVTIDALSVVAQWVDECASGETTLHELDENEEPTKVLYTITVKKGK